jgi:hypothetical protein
MRFRLVLLTALVCSACSTTPGSSALIPADKGLMVGPETGIALDKLVYWGAYIAVAYLILDPLAPNWRVEEAQLDPHLVHFHMKMKRYYSGGGGEARLVLERRAKALVREGNFASYQVIEYKESLDSSVLGSQRVTESVIRLIPKA